MSALVAPMPPRLRLVSAEDGLAPALSAINAASGAASHTDAPEEVPSRPRLRLVAGGADSVSEPPAAPSPALSQELTRRPVVPRRPFASAQDRFAPETRPAVVAGGVGSSGARSKSVDVLAPAHPAVRARRRRELRAHEVLRGARTSAAARLERPDGPSSRADMPRSRTDMSGLPAGVRRLVVLGALVLAAVFIVAGGIVASGFNTSPIATTTAVVQSGQSLWDIAAATNAGDVNEVMAQIVDLNGLTSSTLQAGQRLIVPAG